MSELHEVEVDVLFSKSKLWQLNRDFYQDKGLAAFSDNTVPHHLTTNTVVGKTYAELIFGFLKDLAEKGESSDPVYILELGSGHGRLAYYVLTYLEKLVAQSQLILPSYCYVLSDIGEENLTFFLEHPQFKTFYDRGVLDVAYFDAIVSDSLDLRYSKKTIKPNELTQPIIAIGNYFFDSIPCDLFYVKDRTLNSCYVSMHSELKPQELKSNELIDNLKFTYSHKQLDDLSSFGSGSKILDDYRSLLDETYLFFPTAGLRCIDNVKRLSQKGLFLLSLDKGFHEIHDLQNRKQPDLVAHGSLSVWVNFHALGAYCDIHGGTSMFPSSSTFHLDIAGLLFLEDASTYHHSIGIYERVVNDFGPDDFNSLKHMSYFNAARLTTKELIGLIRLASYDPTFFIKLLPKFKDLAKSVTFNERQRILEAMHGVWEMYYSIGEDHDLAYEIASVFYDLGFYEEALDYYRKSVSLHGPKPDSYYNIALSYYQLRQDASFIEMIAISKSTFPDNSLFESLDKLDRG